MYNGVLICYGGGEKCGVVKQGFIYLQVDVQFPDISLRDNSEDVRRARFQSTRYRTDINIIKRIIHWHIITFLCIQISCQ